MSHDPAPCVHCGKPAEHRAGKDPVCWPPCAHYTAWLRAALADPDMMPWPTRSRRSRHEMMLREAIVDAMRALRGDANPNARPETGPMRFADDWSGIFLRGDYACPMVFALDAALTAMADGKAPSPITIAQLRGLGRVLASCNEGDGEPANVQQMRLFAACVEPSKGNDQ